MSKPTDLELYVASLKQEIADRADCERSLTEWNERLAQEIATLRTERRWVPVTERLPNNGDSVLVHVAWDGKWGKGGDLELATYFESGNTWSFAQIWELGDPVVTHWQLLPQPPQEEAE